MSRIVVIGAGWRAGGEQSELVSARAWCGAGVKRSGGAFSAELLEMVVN